MEDAELPESNRDFLIELDNYLSQDFTAQHTQFVPSRILFPIFMLDSSQLGVLGNVKYDFENRNDLIDITKESDLIQTTDHYKNSGMDNLGKLVYYPHIFDSLKTILDENIFVFTEKNRVNTVLTNFGYYVDECLEYYHYSILKDSIDLSDKALIGSHFPLELIYENFPKIDKIIRNQYADGCYDCSYKFEPETTFAKLKGVDFLYFTYTDTFPLNTEYDYPERALILQIDATTKIDLWIEDVDLFGCSCL